MLALDSKDLITKKYNLGVLTLQQVYEAVKRKQITEDQFHFITGYSYYGIKQEKGW